MLQVPETEAQEGTFVSKGSGTTQAMGSRIFLVFGLIGIAVAVAGGIAGDLLLLVVAGGLGLESTLLAGLLAWFARAHSRRRLTIDPDDRLITLEHFPDASHRVQWRTLPIQTVSFDSIVDAWLVKGTQPYVNVSVRTGNRTLVHRVERDMTGFYRIAEYLQSLAPPDADPRSRPWLERPRPLCLAALVGVSLVVITIILGVVIGILTA